jgi:GNAT superfamily N-acetyltransferase
MEPVVYRAMRSGEEQAACDLVQQVFKEFVAPDYGQEGIKEFFRFANPSAMAERMSLGGFVLVASQADRLAGMLEFVPPDRIAMLFVALRDQGIAKELLTRAISRARAVNPDLLKVTVHSSPYAEPIYLKMGFREIGHATTDQGITYIPMELILDKRSA